jgi:hypothetical protein
MEINKNKLSQREVFQKELFEKVADVIDDYISKIGGYYYKSITNLKNDIETVINKNI